MTNVQELSDQTLVKQFVAGDSKSFELLLERHKGRLFSYIFYTVKNRHKAEDIFQETCIKAITSMLDGRYSESGRFLPWVTRIAHNLIIDHFRQEKQLNICSRTKSSSMVFSEYWRELSSRAEQLSVEQVFNCFS